MKFLLFLTYPFSVLYGIIVRIRHFLYDKGWKKSKKYTHPIICVGNLSVGGTGKSPMTEYLIRFLKSDFKVAVLSRGYKRKTKGFLLADTNSNAQTLGDEPFTYYKNHPDIEVVVCENRSQGIEKLLQHRPQNQVIILDDAFQHRKVETGFSMILTNYGKLFYDDYLLPMGTLRDVKSRAKKANCIIVTKCPETISLEEKKHIIQKINPLQNQKVYFTTIKYADFVQSQTQTIPLSEWIATPFTLVTGIANPTPLISFLKTLNADFKHIRFDDHHHFSTSEIEMLQSKHKILTTEKDFVRLYPHIENTFYIPIKTHFIDINEENSFKKEIISFLNEFHRK